ncbi:SNX19-like protein, partial [Mya arenaria]
MFSIIKKIIPQIREVLSYHRKFTHFQKILISSILVGVLLCVFRNLWFLFITLTYTCAVYISVTLTNYISRSSLCFPSDIILDYVEKVVDFFNNSFFVESPHSTQNIVHENKERNETLNDKGISQSTDFNTQKEKVPGLAVQDTLTIEVNKVICLIQRDFISSWLKLFTENEHLYQESETQLHHIFQGLQGRLYKSQDDYVKLVNVVMLKYKEHVHCLKQSEMLFKAQTRRRNKSSSSSPSASSSTFQSIYKSIEECYASKIDIHPAALDRNSEQAYLRSAIELVLLHLLREDMHDTKALFCALKEMLMYNLVQNIINLLSDPTFLHEKIVAITSDEILDITLDGETLPEIIVSSSSSHEIQSEHQACVQEIHSTTQSAPDTTLKRNVPETSEDLIQHNQDLESNEKECVKECNTSESDKNTEQTVKLLNENLLNEESIGEEVSTVHWLPDTETHEISKFCAECNRLNSEDRERIASKPHSCNLGTLPFFYDPNTKDPDRMSINSFTSVISGSSNEAENDVFMEMFEETQSRRVNSIKSSEKQDSDQEKIAYSETNDINAVSTIESSIKDCHADKAYSNTGPFNPGTDALRDSSPTSESGTKRKRSSLFGINSIGFTFQNPLSSLPFSRKKSVTPEKQESLFPSIENQKTPVTESFEALYPTEDNEHVYKTGTSLLKRPDICNGEELKQFLGYSGDGHIAFVRKIPENTGPRIDQRLVKTMSGVFDKIVEGLPSLPQPSKALPRIISPFDQSDQRTEEEKINLTEDTDEIKVVYSFIEGEDQDPDLEAFISEVVLTWQDNQGLDSSQVISSDQLKRRESTHMSTTDQSPTRSSDDMISKDQSTASTSNHLTSPDQLGTIQVLQSECPLSDGVLDILTELLQGRDNWVCRDKVIHTAKALLGKGLNRFVEEKLQTLISNDMLIFYVRTLQDTAWPGGELSTESRPVYSEGQKDRIKGQATRCLAAFLPGVLNTLLGKEDFDHAVSEIISSLQYEQLNRHFWYTVLDMLLEELFPERFARTTFQPAIEHSDPYWTI